MKFTQDELQHLCTRLYYPFIDPIVSQRATELLCNEFSEHFRNKLGLSDKNVFYKLFYLDPHNRGLNQALKVEWRIHKIDVISAGTKYCKPLHKFIFDHCNPDGYWLLEKSVMGAI